MFRSLRSGPLRAALACCALLWGLGRPAVAQTSVYTPYNFTTVAGMPPVVSQSGVQYFPGSTNGTGSAALFDRPDTVAVDSSGNIYVADTVNQMIREIAPGGVVTTVAGRAATPGSANGVGTAATFDGPTGIAVDSSGNLYIADDGNDVIRKITPSVSGGVTTWTVTTLAGAAGVAGAVDNTGVLAKFNQPFGVAVDQNGNVYVADSANDTIRKVTPAGVVTTVAGTAGVPGSANGTGGAAQFDKPYGLAVDSAGNIYVADTSNSLIRKISPAGLVSTLAGGAASGYGDGTGTAAQFSFPHDVAVDPAGNVYVADTNNGEIRRITPAAVVTTLAGGGSLGADGAGYNAGFSNPSGVALDTAGTVYVADTGDDTIRSGVAVIAPTFTLKASPAACTVASGRSAVFNAIATGSPAPTYQWTLNSSTAIPGATVTNDPILVITGATSADNGTITCTASSTAGSVASSVASSASLSVVAAANPGYLTNLSGRGLVGSGPANALYGGFGISGTGTKQLLIRGMGPSIGPGLYFYIADALQDTQLTLYNSLQAVLAQNSPWGGTPALMTADSLTGAYPPLATTSLDSMLYLPVATGSSSASVGGVGGATGDAVVELYDADSPPLSAKLTNVAVRAPVGTGNDILFGGFSIGGTTAETVLIRAIGPRLGLSPFNLSPVLAQPVLTVYLGGTPTGYTNTGWGGDPALVNAMATVGAYALTASSQDSLLLVTLPPGGYSAEVSGLGGTTGIAAVEVYEVY